MTNRELMEILVEHAKEYAPDASMSIKRNKHMNDFCGDIPQSAIEALIVDFVNFIGNKHCMDLGLYTKDLE